VVVSSQMVVPAGAYPVVSVSEGVYAAEGFHYVLAHVAGLAQDSQAVRPACIAQMPCL
jgi:hypothetical protein